jgi:quercetin dioxygenase-like cupin family protein
MEEPPGFVVRAVGVEPGGDRIYNEREWRDAIVVIARGEIELEAVNGERQRFRRGDILWLCELPLRALHNRGTDGAVLVAVSRRGDDFSDAVRSKRP